MTARQERWYREKDVRQLRERIPHDTPLIVGCRAREGGGTIYTAQDIDHGTTFEGRFQVVAGWIDGFVAAWSWTK